ncbi:hypothetical protein EBZ39_05870, partial [bacterium]|nr:hypothetical protein [bacterium]
MPGTSVFATNCGKDQVWNGSFLADNVHLTWPGSGENNGALVQQVQFQIQRNVNMLYEIGSPNVYYVGGRRQGNATFTRVVSGSSTFRQLATDFGNICKPQDLWLDAKQAACKGSCGGSGGVKYTLMNATLNLVGASVTANDIV